jgi:small subunit ribosomal protein S20
VANTNSAEKRNRQAVKRNQRNTAVKSAVKTAIKKAREAMASGDKTKANAALVAATSLISKAASRGVLHQRNASRHVSRLTLQANKPVTAPVVKAPKAPKAEKVAAAAPAAK